MEFENSSNHENGLRQLQIAAALEAEARSSDSIYDFYNYALELYIDHPFIGGGLQVAARIIEPQDKVLGAEEGIPAAVSFYNGIILGARVADIQGGQVLLDSLTKAPIPYPADPSGDTFEALHVAAGLFLEKGREVYETSSAYHPVIESWIDQLVPDVTKQMYLKCGFGMMLHMINGAERILRHEQAETALEDCDWDAELMKLTQNE